MTHEERLQSHRDAIESWLKTCFDHREAHGDLYDAMRYSLLAGGKRVRPVLTLETCRICGGDPAAALPLACAVEMVHTYSLIHDDLPCMDDDDLRRGRPTNHKVYGEATAVLAGDALLTAAFETILEQVGKISAERAAEAAACLAHAAGGSGMVGGQILDMAGEGRYLSLSEVEILQKLKTGALIRAAAEIGCIAAGGSSEQRNAITKYADCLGLAFQVQDDILDVTGDEATLGKSVGSDLRSEKSTFVSLKGVDACRKLIDDLSVEAKGALNVFGDEARTLCWLVDSLAHRKN